MTTAEWANRTVGEFGRGMGMDDLRLENDAIVCLEFETSGTLFIERVEDCMLVYLARRLPPPRDRIARRSLELCHYREGLPMTIHAGLKDDDTFVFLTRIDRADFSLPILERAFAALTDLHDRAAA